MLKKTSAEWRAIRDEHAAQRAVIESAMGDRDEERENLAFAAGLGGNDEKARLKAFDAETDRMSKEIRDLDAVITGAARYMGIENLLEGLPERKRLGNELIQAITDIKPKISHFELAVQELALTAQDLNISVGELASLMSDNRFGEYGFRAPKVNVFLADMLKRAVIFAFEKEKFTYTWLLPGVSDFGCKSLSDAFEPILAEFSTTINSIRAHVDTVEKRAEELYK